MNETWKRIPGFEGYEVSALGNVRSWLPRTPTARQPTSPRIKKQYTNPDGYQVTSLQVARSVTKTARVHFLVLTAFVGPRPEGLEACHNNGNPADNRLENLRWDTPASNIADQVKHGTRVDNSGEANWAAKLTDEDVREIRRAYGPATGKGSHTIGRPTQAELAAKYGVTQPQISFILRGKGWTHVK